MMGHLGVGSSEGSAQGLGEMLGAVGRRGYLGGVALEQDGLRKRKAEALGEGKALNHRIGPLGTHFLSVSGKGVMYKQEMLLLPPHILPL